MASKPAIRNLLLSKTKIDFIVALTAAIVFAGAYKFGVEAPRRRTIEDFHKNYDPEAAYQRIKKAGVFEYYRNED